VQNDKLTRTFTEEIRALKAQVERMSMVRIESGASQSVIHNSSDFDGLEYGEEEDFFKELKVAPTDSEGEGSDSSVQDLIDDILA